ncbi:hypothetical protein M378DRAFT_162255 [Amanita muscaria Koide BX008]|uniref:Uncharacterized protein n=1 Tax=Amanita muscaria (strain Koide BX008) TaxID=946122 RepID=A0A0C2X960_AMAMK|nr:hypothetical protein M378DRAFT_162255 [Amanita muscaria Koide BX008]
MCIVRISNTTNDIVFMEIIRVAAANTGSENEVSTTNFQVTRSCTAPSLGYANTRTGTGRAC